MELAETEIGKLLLQQNQIFQRLAAQHQEYEDRLAELASKPRPTEQERLQEIELKKRKLALKDRMAAMVREFRREKQAAAAR